MASVVQICNSALNQLGAASITALTDNSKNARLCNARYETIRDAVYRSHPWNCLIKRQQLAQDTATPAYGFKFQFTLPSDCLRLLGLDAYNSDHKVEGRKILCNESTIKISYVAQITDPNIRETYQSQFPNPIPKCFIPIAILALMKMATIIPGTAIKKAFQKDFLKVCTSRSNAASKINVGRKT